MPMVCPGVGDVITWLLSSTHTIYFSVKSSHVGLMAICFCYLIFELSHFVN